MKKMQKPVLLVVTLLLVLVLCCACAQKDQTTGNIPTATVPEVPLATAGSAAAATQQPQSAVLATLNGYPVRQDEVEEIAANLAAAYAASGYAINTPESIATLRSIAMNYALQMTMLDLKADEWGIVGPQGDELTELKAEIHQEWETLVEYYMGAMFGINDQSDEQARASARSQALAMLASAGYTEEYLLETAIRDSRREQVQAEMVKDIRITDEEVQAAYEAQVRAEEAGWQADPVSYIYTYEMTRMYTGKSPAYVPQGYRGVLQILLPVDEELLTAYQTLSARMEEQVEKTLEDGSAATGEAVTQEQVDAAREAILASVQPTYDLIVTGLANGTPFLDLVDKYNTDPGMQDEKTRAEGYPVHLDSVVYDPAFISAAFSVPEIGGISAPVVGSYGVYVTYYLRDIPAGPSGLTDQLRSDLTEKLLGDREDEVITDNMTRWLEEATLVMTDAGNAYVSGK